MKTLFVSLLTFFLIFLGCSSSKETSQNKIEVISAKYNKWSEPPLHNSDVPEKGVDLTVTVRNWTTKFKADHIIYQNRKSYKPRLADTTNNQGTIKARIITSSSIMQDNSESIDLSDRLVFTTPDGETGYIEIENWERK